MRALRFSLTILPLAIVLLVGATAPLVAQQPESGLVADLMRDIEEVEKKMIDLARAIPAEKFGWRPAEGVRSVSEVVLHVASDNYFIPALGGVAAPAETGIKGEEYNTAVAYEKRTMNRDAAIAALEQSFAHVKKALAATTEAKLAEALPQLGENGTVRGLWLLAATHVHEHLGQLIAYARSNGVVPPWSRPGG
jgi:uncharacterized damage-inducible protein DinB